MTSPYTSIALLHMHQLKDLEEVLQDLWGSQVDLGQQVRVVGCRGRSGVGAFAAEFDVVRLQISQMMEALTKAEFEKKALQTKVCSVVWCGVVYM